MFKSLVLSVVLMSSVSTISTSAFAHCEECPVPMASWIGHWWSDDTGLGIEIQRATGSLNRVKVIVHDSSTGKVIAIGSGFIPDGGTPVLSAKIWSTDGRVMTTRLTVDTDTGHLTLNFANSRGESLSGYDLPSEIDFFE